VGVLSKGEPEMVRDRGERRKKTGGVEKSGGRGKEKDKAKKAVYKVKCRRRRRRCNKDKRLRRGITVSDRCRREEFVLRGCTGEC